MSDRRVVEEIRGIKRLKGLDPLREKGRTAEEMGGPQRNPGMDSGMGSTVRGRSQLWLLISKREPRIGEESWARCVEAGVDEAGPKRTGEYWKTSY